MKRLFAIMILSVAFPAFASGSRPTSDVNTQNSKGETSVMVAASQGEVKTLKSLIAKKANLNLKDKSGNTALFFAISNENTEAAKLLIEAGAELGSFNENGDSALMTAVSFNNTELIKLILKKRPQLLNLESPEKQTPLMKAAEVGSVETVQILVNAGADLKARDKLDRTAYDIAKESQNTESLKYLKAKAAR